MKPVKMIKFCSQISGLLLFGAWLGFAGSSNQPQEVRRIIYEQHPDEWYAKQADLWRVVVEKEPQNARAWYNYYNAER